MLRRLKENWKAGLTVALISIPLSISLAMASGASPTAGILTAIAAGIVGALFGGGEYNVIGPTGALSGITAAFAIANGAELLPMLTIFVGIVIIIGYYLKVERYLIFVPSSVIHGFTLAVAIILTLNQVNYSVGLNALPQKASVIDNLMVTFANLQSVDFPTIIAFAIFLASLILMRKYKSKIPGAIILAPIAILIGYLGEIGVLGFNFFTLGDKFGEISLGLSYPTAFVYSKQLMNAALTISFIAIVETMLSAKIADTMTHTKHNPRKEMLSLGLANIASGLVGGIPATAALARTSLNIRSGGKHRTSGIVNGVFIALISFLLLSQFKYIPMAAIAAILVDTALKMVEMNHFKKFWKYDKASLGLAMFVAVITVFEDPIVGILLGVAISFLLFVEKISHGHFELKVNDDSGIVKSVSGDKLKPLKEDGSILLYSIRGNLLYINSSAHISRFESDMFDNYKVIVFRLREVYMVDLDGIEALDEMINILKAKGITVFLTSISPALKTKLRRSSKEFIYMENHGFVFDKTRFALNSIGIPTKGE